MIDSWAPVYYYGVRRTAPIVLICEHAAFEMPDEYEMLGIDRQEARSHIAGDIGALQVAKGLSDRLECPLVHGGVSRLIYDCNRPFQSIDAIASKSEKVYIPGNVGLSVCDRKERFRIIHNTFHTAVDGLIQSHLENHADTVIVTVHSFTPIYYNEVRLTEIGFLHDKNSLLSEILCRIEQRRGVFRAALNRPYASIDGVTYTLQRHAESKQLHSTMIEIKNDLVENSASADKMAAHLSVSLTEAIGALNSSEKIA